MTQKYFYAASNLYGKTFSYDSAGWFVFRFSSKQARDQWVSANEGEKITRKLAKKMTGNYTKAIPIHHYERLDPTYTNQYFWN